MGGKWPDVILGADLVYDPGKSKAYTFAHVYTYCMQESMQMTKLDNEIMQ